MKKREIVFTIIKKLEKAEKRLIKLELSKFKPSSAFISIYNYFEKCTEFDEVDFKDFCQKNKIVNTNVHLDHLYKKILQLLIQYKDTLAVDDIDIKIHILREYGFLKEAAKKYKTALKLSAENSRYILNSFLDQMNWITNKITNTYSNYIVFMELLALEYVEMPSDKRNKKVLEYVPKEYESTNLHEFISYYNVKMSQAFSDKILYAEVDMMELIKVFEMNDEKYLTAFIKNIKGKHSLSFYVSPIIKLLLALIVPFSFWLKRRIKEADVLG